MKTTVEWACCLTITLAVSALGASSGFAQDEESVMPRDRMIEEVIVTAQRREQAQHDVPISMSAFGDNFLQQQGVTDLQDVSFYVPNVRIDQSGTFIQPRIRGFSTNTVVNRGLQLPVGLVVDEVPYSRADYFAVGLFDIGRVEVLRGPQGQLFGANTTVGLLNLSTKNPTDEFTGFIEADAGELDRRRFQGALGGPLVPGWVNFRIAALSDERGDFVDNTTARVEPEADEALGGRDRESWRGKLDFPDLFGASLLISYQRDDFHYNATPREITSAPERFREFMLKFDPNTDFEPGNFVGSVDTPSFRKAEIETATAIGRYDLGGWGLNLVGGWSSLKSSSEDDADSGPWPVTDAIVNETSRQTTAEFRVASPDLAGFFGLDNLFGLSLGHTEFTTGIFFQRREQRPTHSSSAQNVPMVLLLAAMRGDESFLVPPAPPPEKWEFFAAEFRQTADELSGFGQMSWHFLDRWTLIAGIRVSEIEKEASWVQELGAEDGPCCIIEQFIAEFTAEESNTEYHTAPKGGLKFDWSENLNFYATWSEGFQPGGFNNFTTTDEPEGRRVDPAFVDSWEAGSKMRLFDGALQLNLGLFWMTMEDFQLFTVAPPPDGEITSRAKVVNVGQLRARGVEADTTWLPTNWLSLRAAIGYNDSEYLDFPVGTCFGDRRNTDGDDDPRCDLTGEPLEQAPKWEVSLTPSINLPLTSIPGLGDILPAFLKNVDLTSTLAIQYTDDRFLQDSNDPRTEQPAFFLLNGGLGFANATQGWSMQVRIENLTDKRFHNAAYEGIPAAGVAMKSPAPPRSVHGQFRWNF